MVFGSTQITATATNKEGTEIRNCEFKFETAGTASQPEKVEEQKTQEPSSEKKKPVVQDQQNETQNTTADQTAALEEESKIDQDLNKDLL